MKYMVLDHEVQNHEEFRRFASPFCDRNWIVARGYKVQGAPCASVEYYPENKRTGTFIPLDVTILVGHNIKFDLLFEWEHLQEFFARGGKIWDTQYAEYLIEAMHPDVQMISLDKLAPKYGGTQKIDEVKMLWDAGVLTADIDKDLLINYLIGTEQEARNGGDIGNTEKIFLGQIVKAKELGMIPMIQARMDALLCTTEMEFRGLKIDIKEAARAMKKLNAELELVMEELDGYIPAMPPELEFSWASKHHVSCLIFGGAIKYRKIGTYIDPDTGELARKKGEAQWPLVDGVPVNPADLGHLKQDVFTSGKKKGMPRFQKVAVPGELKTKYQDHVFRLPGYTEPKAIWATKNEDADGNPIYGTDADIIEELGSRDIGFLKALAKRQNIVKDLSTYYTNYDEKKGYVGMLTCVNTKDHIIHHALNHVATVTSRLSSSNPNLQNIPRGDTSEVKLMFVSRFGENGLMLEADYSQLEVVIQGMLSEDPQLCEDLRNKIDFHCKRVAVKYGVTYEEALYRCKDSSYPEFSLWKTYRTNCKVFSFQRAYGAGAKKISESTGIPFEDVVALIDAEEIMYPRVVAFNAEMEAEIKKSAFAFRDDVRGGKVYHRGYWQAPTGTRYTFRSYDAPAFMQKKGYTDTFKPTEIKNYAVQGTGGEVVQIVLGKLYRHFLSNNNYGGKAFLCNTVHDCVWIDVHKDVVEQVARDVQRIMQDVPKYLKELYDMDVTVPFPVEVEVGKNLYDKQVYHVKENHDQ